MLMRVEKRLRVTQERCMNNVLGVNTIELGEILMNVFTIEVKMMMLLASIGDMKIMVLTSLREMKLTVFASLKEM